jgi:hypothetical protein
LIAQRGARQKDKRDAQKVRGLRQTGLFPLVGDAEETQWRTVRDLTQCLAHRVLDR